MIRHGYRMAVLLIALVSIGGGCVRGGVEITREQVIDSGVPRNYLTCAETAVAFPRPDTAMIPPGGGSLRSGDNRLNIPSRALAETRRFILSVADSSRNGARDTAGVIIDAGGPVSFRGLSATLTIDLSRCRREEVNNQDGWSVWRINRRGGLSQELRSVVVYPIAIVDIDSASVFMIAN